MIEVAVMAVVFVLYTTGLFVYVRFYNKDNVDLFFGLICCVFAAMLWFITLPALFLLGIAWLISKGILKLLNV